jgi:hypothetical protein
MRARAHTYFGVQVEAYKKAIADTPTATAPTG